MTIPEGRRLRSRLWSKRWRGVIEQHRHPDGLRTRWSSCTRRTVIDDSIERDRLRYGGSSLTLDRDSFEGPMGDFPRRLRVRTFAPKEAAARATALLAEVRKVAVVCKDGMSKERQSRAFGFLRVPPEAIAIALELAEGDPGSFPHFDVQLARLALIYGKEMGAVAQLCRAVAARIEEDMTQLHAGAAEETLAVNASAKPWSRV